MRREETIISLTMKQLSSIRAKRGLLQLRIDNFDIKV
jgi:hypothetical protein